MTVLKLTTLSQIRSYVRRQGRITQAQQYALDYHSQHYCLDPQIEYNFSEVFERNAALIVEIGFGNGETLASMAAANPDINYIGIEVHLAGVGHLMMLLDQQGLTNVRIYCHDAMEILEQKFQDNSLAGIHLFFPDPWPKKKHHKRRIVRDSFVDLLIKKLQVGGYFHTATDWQDYAQSMLAVLTANTCLENTSASNDYCPRPEYRPLTKFEHRGMRLGHGVWDLIFKKP